MLSDKISSDVNKDLGLKAKDYSNLHSVDWHSTEWRFDGIHAICHNTINICCKFLYRSVYINCKNELVAYLNHLKANFIAH